MRLRGRSEDCGQLWELGWIRRQLHLPPPVGADAETISVADIIGTVHRSRDFDGCWHPLSERLAKRLADIDRSHPGGPDEPIDVVRVDRAYFVVDGHKRVALARQSGREFIDARVSRVASAYALPSQLDEQAIVRTAREGEFRRHSGLGAVEPAARFALTDIDAYGELFRSVQKHAYELSEGAQRLVTLPEAAPSWYRSVYRPTVDRSRATIGLLLDSATDADVFVAIERRRAAWWGTECDAVECAEHQLLLDRRLEAARSSSIVDILLGREVESGTHAPLLPLTDAEV